jgi:hypothetical protein
MAKKATDFNLTATIREFQQHHKGVSAREAFDAIKKAHPAQKINEGTFKATFYKLSGGGKRRVVRTPKPGRALRGGGDHAEAIMRSGLHFIRLSGGVEQARERLVGLEQLIETARAVE